MNSIEQIAEKFKSKKIGLFFEEELSARSSFKIGGKAALLAEPSDEESLAFALTEIRNAKIPYFVLGGGTNVLFSDAGFDGIIVSTKKLSDISIVESHSGNERIAQDQDCAAADQDGGKTIIRAGAGTSMAALVSFAQEKALSGLEEFAGLPGTVGGAAFMNARCFDREMSEVAAKITWLEWTDNAQAQDAPQNQDGAGAFRVKSAVFAPSDWAYKKSPFTGTGRVVLSAEFIVQKGDKASIAQKAAAFIQERKDKGHYKAPCAGSVFKNNRAFGRPTGKIIDELGLKGEKRGGAQIAPFHGNIIINAGGASSADVRALIDLCKSAALEKFGFKLEEEIVVV
jgi:UDP-N-acetylmuramate dehydrogenase